MGKKFTIIFLAIIVFGLFGLVQSSWADMPWSGILDSSHAIDWSRSGIPEGIPTNRTQCGSTVAPYTGSTAAINTAISNCTSGHYVQLGAGTFTLTSGYISLKSGVTLRGMGPLNTILNMTLTTYGGCSAPGQVGICAGGSMNYYQQAQNVADWTAGYTKGSTTITVSSTANMVVGGVLILDQVNDPIDSGGLTISDQSPFISTAGTPAACRDSAQGRRCQQEYHEITAIDGNNITIDPVIQMPNWDETKSPQVWYATTTVTKAGVEDLTLDTGSSGDYAAENFFFFSAHKCWIKNVRSIQAYKSGGVGRAHVHGLSASNIEVRDSYFYGTKNQSSLSYGIEIFNGGNWLVENNIFHHLTSPIVPGTGAGNVYAYNYDYDNYCTDPPGCSATWGMPGPVWGHDAGSTYILQEGNEGTGTVVDALHGASGLMTAFRNQFAGRDTGKTNHTQVVELNIYQRYHNFIGNVMGEAGYHNKYSTTQPDGSSCATSIYSLGWDTQGCGGTRTDPRTVATLMRWGNYDVVTGNVKWDASEVPRDDAFYPNAVPADHTLPASFYLSSKPSWFGSVPWPAVGPDVTGGNVTSGTGGESTLDGHAYKIPARLCYENTSKDGNGILNFDANNCYYSSSDTTPPAAPSGLSVL